jgi:DNA-binding IclR family transcriptional regulator
MRNGDRDTVIGRAFRVLDTFDGGRPELTLDEIAEHSGLSRSTAHRLAGQLVRQGALERSRRGWRLGTRMFELGQLVVREQRLRERALAYMQDLYTATGETVQLAVPDAGAVLYVEIISGHRKVATPSRRGGRMPMHCTALGKALLAFSADGGREFLAGEPELEARTPRTIVDLAALRQELHEVRVDQLAYDREEAALGLCCVAAPILDGTGTAAAALSVSMPAGGRLTLAEVAPAIRTVARALTREGWPR